MRSRLPASAPALLVVAAACLFASATISLAAETQATLRSHGARKASGPGTVVVPDLRRQSFVFAKGLLEDEGYSWRVVGSVQGYAANLVVKQTPLPGTRLVDTGSPLITLKLARNHHYRELGQPEDRSPYPATTTRVSRHTAR